MALTYYEKLELVSKQKNEEDMLKTLYKIGDPGLKVLLSYTFDDNITWLLPDGDPPFTPMKDDVQNMVMRLPQEIRRLHIFVNIGPYKDMAAAKRQSLFIDLLEAIHPDDAKLILAIKAGKLPFPKLNRKFFEKAYPKLKDKWVKK